ncbi:MAG TPA: helix-turn-helix domain-containing protein [Solirubrobacterales bacterium]|jgi:AcrR family transcriptional regulator|nr:helix-turn-helix domain-containing protein [Solirubrobacterales bacterium]
MRSVETRPAATEKRTGRGAIIRAAFRVFGEAGIESTSLREVARAAEVSPALVVHHFGGKEGLVAAVDDAALREFGAAYRGGPGHGAEATVSTAGRDRLGDVPDGAPDLLRDRAVQTARVMAEVPEVCRYLGRALVEGTAGSAALFRLMVEAGRGEIDSLAAAGALRPDADREWATLQHFFLIWAPLSFMPLLREALGEDLLAPGQLDRWVDANVALLEGGLYKGGAPDGAPGEGGPGGLDPHGGDSPKAGPRR